MSFETEEIQVCHDCRMFLANGDLPNNFPNFVNYDDEERADGETDPEAIDANDVYWHPADIHGADGNYPSHLGWALSVEDGESDEFSVYQCAACGMREGGARYPVTAVRPAMKVTVSYGEDVWNEAGELVDPWNKDEKAFEANPSAFSQTVTLYCDNQARAEEDQSVLGSSWECPGDMSVAYACASEYEADQVCKALREEGYDVTEDPNTYALHS